jgi:hypothetical protein
MNFFLKIKLLLYTLELKDHLSKYKRAHDSIHMENLDNPI